MQASGNNGNILSLLIKSISLDKNESSKYFFKVKFGYKKFSTLQFTTVLIAAPESRAAAAVPEQPVNFSVNAHQIIFNFVLVSS